MYLGKIAFAGVIFAFFIGLFTSAFPYSYEGLKTAIGFDIFELFSDLFAFLLNFIPDWVLPTFLTTFVFFTAIKIAISVYNKLIQIWGAS